MNTMKIGATVMGLTLSLSLLAWAQSPPSVENLSAAPRAEIKGTYSHATDTKYLYDQIELKIEFKSGAKFVLAARPGENIYVTVPAGRDTEKRMALVAMPAPFGEKIVDRQDLMAREPASIGFRLMPYCLNSLSESHITDKTTSASCRARSIEDDEADFVLPLSGLMKKDIAIGETVKEEVTGTEVTIIGYRSSGYASFQQFNPYSKCCRINEGVELCACALSSPTSECDSGCPESEPMRAAADWEAGNRSPGLD